MSRMETAFLSLLLVMPRYGEVSQRCIHELAYEPNPVVRMSQSIVSETIGMVSAQATRYRRKEQCRH